MVANAKGKIGRWLIRLGKRMDPPDDPWIKDSDEPVKGLAVFDPTGWYDAETGEPVEGLPIFDPTDLDPEDKTDVLS